MRDGYTEELLQIERLRRRDRFGHKARIAQLKWASGLCFALACVCWLHIWWYPRASEHVWIDDVLVEVVAEGWLDTTASVLFLSSVLCVVLLIAFSLCAAPERDFQTMDMDRMLGRSRRRADANAAKRNATSSVPSLSVPRRAANVVAAAGATLGGRWLSKATTGSLFDAERPMRSAEELNRYLDTLAQQRVPPGRSEVTGLRGHDVGDGMPASITASYGRQQSQYGSSAWATGAPGYGVVPDLHQGTVRVLYEVGGNDAVRAAQAGLDWGSLGVMQPELCLGRMREWVSDACRKLIDEVDQCDRWFRENDVMAFDCANPLSEVVPGGFGGMSAPAPPPPTAPVTKQMMLLREKEQVRSYHHGGEHFNTGLRYDQRLSLESRLDVTATFVPDQPMTSIEQRHTRSYVLSRLRSLAKQRTLVLFKNNGGDAQQWRPGLPCDAHLLLHVLRTSIEGLFPYVRFGYQGALSAREDLALFVGDTGAPYFYVRHFRGGRDRLYVTQPGQATLFEALLVFTALIHLYHGDRYGGVRGTIDLEEAGLLRVLTGRSTQGYRRSV